MEVPNQHPYPLIESVMAALQHNNLQPTSEEVADALWLAHKIRQARPLETASPVKADVEESRHPAEEAKQRQKEDSELRSTPSENGNLPALDDYNVYPSSASGKGLRAGIPFKSPTASALPGARYLERSLRPFMHRVPSRTKLIFDESATVERIANEEIWAPVLSFAQERCFEVALVVEESASMVIWQQTIAEFSRLLSRLGAFRDVRVWKLATDREKIQLYEGTKQTVGSRRPRHPDELIDPTRRRLILLVSDCVASTWHNGQVTKLLAIWADVSPVALVQVFPQRLWRRTALDTAIELSLHARAANLPNRQLQAESDDLWPDEWPSNGVKMPIVTLEPESLALWAQMVTGAGVQMAGFLLNPNPPLSMEHDSEESRSAPLSPMERLRHFHSTVTPIAYKLATYFAAIPLTLPIMRLVQHTMLPKSRQVHLAEVFLSGLLKQIGTADDPTHIQYDFVDGVRDLLLNSLLVTEAVDVLGTVSNFIAKQTGQPLDFQALIADPNATDGIVISEHSRPFATIAAEVLSRFGGRYVQVAEELESVFSIYYVEKIDKPYHNVQSLTPDTENALADVALTIQSIIQDTQSAFADVALTIQSLTQDTQSAFADVAPTIQSLTQDTQSAFADVAPTIQSITQDTQSAFADVAPTIQSLTQDTQSSFADVALTIQSLTQDTESALADVALTIQSLTQDTESATANFANNIPTEFTSNVLVPYKNELTDFAQTMQSLIKDTENELANLTKMISKKFGSNFIVEYENMITGFTDSLANLNQTIEVLRSSISDFPTKKGSALVLSDNCIDESLK